MHTNDQLSKKTQAIEKFLKDNPEKRIIKNEFSEQFSIIELECKTLILDNWHSNKKKLDTTTAENIQLRFHSIKNSLGSNSSYAFSDDFLMKIFGGKQNKINPYKTRGRNSLKILRDEIFHELNLNAINELYDRKKEIFSLIKQFRNAVENK